MTPTAKRLLVAGALALTLVLSACGSSDPLDSADDGGGDGKTIVIGSQDYYSSEIIAEIYAQALEAKDYPIDRQFRIGQREVYLPEIENGSIDLFPEYTGPLLQQWNPDTTARASDAVYEELKTSAPSGLRVLEQSSATDQDAYVVTKAFADQWGLTTIDDLAKVTTPLTLGGNSEGLNRPNGPTGLKNTYGIDVGFTPIEDGGGPLTVKALQDGSIQMAIIYTADPSIVTNGLVALEDSRGLFLASHVVPVAGADVDDDAAAIINAVNAALTSEGLVDLNARSVSEQLPAATIAKDWLAQQNLG